MELTKERIESVEFTCKRGKYYLAREVDHFMDSIANNVDEMSRELTDLREQVEQLKMYRNQSEELEEFRVRVEQLQKNLDERLLHDSTVVVRQANQQAREIITQVSDECDQMLADANSQRNRIIAANRAAYYNALQFKQELARQFKELESDLDQAIDVLRSIEPVQAGPSFVQRSIPYTADRNGEAADFRA